MTILRKTAAALMIAAIFFAGCDKDNGDDDPADKTTPAMTIIAARSGQVMIGLAGTGIAVIDWGDGSATDTVTLSAYSRGDYFGYQIYTHTFPGTTSHTIVIKGKNITHLNCGELQLTALDVTKNTVLIELWCAFNQLMKLDVTKNTALRRLGYAFNQLTALDVIKNTALNRFALLL